MERLTTTKGTIESVSLKSHFRNERSKIHNTFLLHFDLHIQAHIELRSQCNTKVSNVGTPENNIALTNYYNSTNSKELKEKHRITAYKAGEQHEGLNL